jgi:hypothetical protein
MSSHEHFQQQSIDHLITEALQAQVRDVEPSPHVRERILRQAKKRAARARAYSGWNWGAVFPSVFMTTRGGLVALQWDVATLRFLDYAEIRFRFGW